MVTLNPKLINPKFQPGSGTRLSILSLTKRAQHHWTLETFWCNTFSGIPKDRLLPAGPPSWVSVESSKLRAYGLRVFTV